MSIQEVDAVLRLEAATLANRGEQIEAFPNLTRRLSDPGYHDSLTAWAKTGLSWM